VQTWHCPRDAGDANYLAQNCFTGYGSSYVTQHDVDSWRTEHVTADSDPGSAAGAVPIKVTTVALSAANKIIQGDWEWENNGYNVNNPLSWWHNDKGQRRQNILFADGHVAYFQLPDQVVNWISSPPPDMGYLWW
jgi:prepilin-type processing-associated H-X9-DG protein